VFLALALGAREAESQGLSDYDYEDLSFRGIGLDIGYNWPDLLEESEAFGVRVDLGYLGPAIRILPRVGYWSSRMKPGEVRAFEDRVAELVADQNPDSPPPLVDLGTIEWRGITVGTDAQFVWRVPRDVLTYLGVGVAAHFNNGSGDAVDDTFVEDLLDSTVAGANVHAGLEVPLGRRLRAYGDARYELTGDVSFFGVRAGLQVMFQDPAPGERGAS
jgi:hypothetical protein